MDNRSGNRRSREHSSARLNVSVSDAGDTPSSAMLDLPLDLLEDWLTFLIQQNDTDLKNTDSAKKICFKNPPLVQFVFHICNLLRQPREVRYLAIEMFNRFIINHLRQLYSHVLTEYNVKHQSAEWSTILRRVRNQLSLRVLTCCRIASKLFSHYKTISGWEVLRLLTDMGQKYTMNGIFQSEVRVLQTLDFRIALTPLDYIETLLLTTEYMCCLSNVSTYRAVCLDVLDVTYFKWSDIDEQFTSGAASKSRDAVAETDRSPYYSSSAGCEDFMLLAAAVISCASYLFDQSLTDTIVEKLSKMTGLSVDTILDLAIILVQQIIITN